MTTTTTAPVPGPTVELPSVCACGRCIAAEMLRYYSWPEPHHECACCCAEPGQAHASGCEILLCNDRHGVFDRIRTRDVVTALYGKYQGEWMAFDELRLANGFRGMSDAAIARYEERVGRARSLHRGQWTQHAEQRIDFWACHPWPSKSVMVGYEIKVSRGDGLKELKNPDNRPALETCNKFFVIAPRRNVVRPAELFNNVGLIEVRWGDSSGYEAQLVFETVVEATFRQLYLLPTDFVKAIARRAARVGDHGR